MKMNAIKFDSARCRSKNKRKRLGGVDVELVVKEYIK